MNAPCVICEEPTRYIGPSLLVDGSSLYFHDGGRPEREYDHRPMPKGLAR